MISVEEALERILSRVAPLGDEQVDLGRVPGRVLAEDIDAPEDLPAWPSSSMDGYAVRAADTASASERSPARLTLAGRVRAGTTAGRPMREGEAYRIFTGAPMPRGGDAVVPQEDVSALDGAVVVSRPVEAGAYVRPRGEDLTAGMRVLGRGRVLSAADVGLLATLGRTGVTVVRRPRVGILSTGDEVVDLGGSVGPGQIRNSNSYSLMAQVAEVGAEPVSLGVARDEVEDIERRVGWGAHCDALLSSAGVSVGEHDVVKTALARRGAEQHLWLVDMRPGKPVAFATIPRGGEPALPVWALPGNPVSAMVTFELFVRPALLKMSGHTRLHRPMVTARALAPIPNPGRRRGYLRVTLEAGPAGFGARLTGEQGSGILRSLVLAHGLAVVPGDTTIVPGGEVAVVVLRDP
jgi:molybdopterin molybdotransferase